VPADQANLARPSDPAEAYEHPEDRVPTYQYRCTECGHELEAVQKFTDDPLTVCPSCEGSLRKVFSAVGVVFKGSGFYRTDSRSNGDKTSSHNGSGHNGSEHKSDSDTSSSAKAETKSDSHGSDGAKKDSGASNSSSSSANGTASASKSKSTSAA